MKIVAVDRIRSDEDYDRVAAFMEEIIAEIGRKKTPGRFANGAVFRLIATGAYPR